MLGWLSTRLSLYSGQAVANLGWMLAIPIILLMLATPMYSILWYHMVLVHLDTSGFSNDLVGKPQSEAMNAHIMILFWRIRKLHPDTWHRWFYRSRFCWFYSRAVFFMSLHKGFRDILTTQSWSGSWHSWAALMGRWTAALSVCKRFWSFF